MLCGSDWFGSCPQQFFLLCDKNPKVHKYSKTNISKNQLHIDMLSGNGKQLLALVAQFQRYTKCNVCNNLMLCF